MGPLGAPPPAPEPPRAPRARLQQAPRVSRTWLSGGHRLGGRERGQPLARGLTRPFARSPFLRGRNRSLKARARRRCVAFALEREASVGQSHRIVRVEARRLVEVGDGAVVLVLIEPDEAAIEECHRVVGIEPQRLAEIRGGAFVLPARTQRAAPPDIARSYRLCPHRTVCGVFLQI